MYGNIPEGKMPAELEKIREAIKRENPGMSEDRTYAIATHAFKQKHNIKGKTTEECTAQEHLAVLASAQKYVDSAVSKTINVNPNMPWEDFKGIYMKAWENGCKGCTTFNPSGKRFGVLNSVKEEKEEEGAEACYIDPNTGKKSCE